MVRSPLSGQALGFAVQYVTSEIHRARPGASKAVVILVTDVSTDSVAAAADAARSNRKCPADSPETVRNCSRTSRGKVLLSGVLADLNAQRPHVAWFQTAGNCPIPVLFGNQVVIILCLPNDIQ